MMKIEIRVKGKIDEHWSEWFDNLSVHYDEKQDSILTGFIPDQAALQGLLARINDLGLTLHSVHSTIICDHPA